MEEGHPQILPQRIRLRDIAEGERLRPAHDFKFDLRILIVHIQFAHLLVAVCEAFSVDLDDSVAFAQARRPFGIGSGHKRNRQRLLSTQNSHLMLLSVRWQIQANLLQKQIRLLSVKRDDAVVQMNGVFFVDGKTLRNRGHHNARRWGGDPQPDSPHHRCQKEPEQHIEKRSRKRRRCTRQRLRIRQNLSVLPLRLLCNINLRQRYISPERQQTHRKLNPAPGETPQPFSKSNRELLHPQSAP